MSKSLDWRNYVDQKGDFELPSYLYSLITDLMKQSLDMGTLLSNDPAKTRAFKEQIKKIFKDRWNTLAQALEFFEIVVPCSCGNNFCEFCKGSRYLLNSALSPDMIREVAFIQGPENDPALAEKLRRGHEKAMQEIEKL